ncbi:helix-turn-helix transcriptional regulator [Buchananella felis]|uniref:helix-turn-helix transcriptional regulator n=1 Tax=Buchananella felis TaxID=3231492 RepID=UPI003526E117
MTAGTTVELRAGVPNFTKQIGAAIRKARKHHGLTQRQLADLIELSDRTLRQIENGVPGPSFDSVMRAAYAVGVRVEVGAP